MSIGKQSEKIVDQLIQNLRDRKGLGDEYAGMDEDIQFDLEEEWRLIVRRILERG